MPDFRRMLTEDYRLTTAEILYRFPDYPDLLQTYVWQEYDVAPRFPALQKFLGFWEREIEGRLHSVRICTARLITPAEMRYAQGVWSIN